METKRELVEALDRALEEYEEKYGESKKFIPLCDSHAWEWKKHYLTYSYKQKTIGDMWEDEKQRCMICELTPLKKAKDA
jgi:hypothetical protein